MFEPQDTDRPRSGAALGAAGIIFFAGAFDQIRQASERRSHGCLGCKPDGPVGLRAPETAPLIAGIKVKKTPGGP